LHEGNIEADWVGQNNTVESGITHRGCTRTTRAAIHSWDDSGANDASGGYIRQTSGTAYAELYNPTAAYTIGRVWKDHATPTSQVIFVEAPWPVNCCSQATVAQVPYLAGAEWQANAGASFSSTERSPQTVRDCSRSMLP
jgi:hypothetical protein